MPVLTAPDSFKDSIGAPIAGRLDQHRLDVSPGVPGPPVLALAYADVVPRAQRDPGG